MDKSILELLEEIKILSDEIKIFYGVKNDSN